MHAAAGVGVADTEDDPLSRHPVARCLTKINRAATYSHKSCADRTTSFNAEYPATQEPKGDAMRKLLGLASSLCLISTMSIAAAEPSRSVVFDNECLHVLRAEIGPHEKTKSFIDTRPAFLVFLTDSAGFHLTYPDGRDKYTGYIPAQTVFWYGTYGREQQENVGDTPLVFIV